MMDRPLASETWEQALRAHRAERWAESFALAEKATAEARAAAPASSGPLAGASSPRIREAVALAARNLFHLDRRRDFRSLVDRAHGQGLVPDPAPELEVVELSFACKRGEYADVVREASAYISAHREELRPVLADYLLLRGLAHTRLGNPRQALEDAEAAHALFRLLERDRESGRAANLMGLQHLRAAGFAEAERWFRRALDVHTRLGAAKNAGGNRLNLAIILGKRGRFTEAANELTAARQLLEEAGAHVSLCRARLAQGQVRLVKGDVESATESLQTAFKAAGELKLVREEALALEFLGDVALAEGRVEHARRYFSRALSIGRTIAPEGDVVMEVLRRQGVCLAAQGREIEALPVLSRSLGLARRLGEVFEEGVILRIMAETQLALGDADAAVADADRAAEILDGIGADYELGVARLVQARAVLVRLDARGGTPEALETAWHRALSALDLLLRTEIEERIRDARQLLAEISRRRNAPPSVESSSTAGPAQPVIVHASPAMRDALQLCDAFADSDEPVLVTGPTGTGKELIARRLHERSRRHAKPLVCVNVSAIPDGIFAREFFGHVRGAYSGADGGGSGLAAAADGGTLFLDEIGDLPLEQQPQLLRLLQDGTFQSIGDPSERRVDIRLVAATNADLQEMVAAGRFRADLYYRLKILELRLLPLRDRIQDLQPLLRHFLGEATGRPVRLSEYFSASSLDLMEHYEWPGNAREVAMVARQAHVQLLSRGNVRVEVGATPDSTLVLSGPRSEVPDQVRLSRGAGDRNTILRVLAEAQGNRAEAARLLGVSRSTLYRRLEKLGIGAKTSAC
ncbi:MAG: AAA domain-containing protein [bacterium]|nr:AAA domain-containing protein [bacterium]